MGNPLLRLTAHVQLSWARRTGAFSGCRTLVADSPQKTRVPPGGPEKTEGTNLAEGMGEARPGAAHGCFSGVEDNGA